MELRQIYYVMAVARERNFSRAARSMYVSQSNVSQQIRALETELGIRLFERDHHSVVLTEAGHRFCLEAENVVRAIDHLLFEVDKKAL